MTIMKNGIGDVVAFLPKVIITDPSLVDYPRTTPQADASYIDLCDDVIRGCDIGIEKLQKLRQEYEQRRVMAAMGVPPVFDVSK
ncbi:TPA: hypothetical protein ACWZ76_004311 [Klebsiella pneumoniae]